MREHHGAGFDHLLVDQAGGLLSFLYNLSCVKQPQAEFFAYVSSRRRKKRRFGTKMTTEERPTQTQICEKKSFEKIQQVIDFESLFDESMFAWATV